MANLKREPREEWYTIAVTPLPPGYRAAYGVTDDGNRIVEYMYEPIPAALLQENRGEERDYSKPGNEIRTTIAPYPTRVVMSVLQDYVGGIPRGYAYELDSADRMGGLVCILAPGEPDLLLSTEPNATTPTDD